MTTIQHFHGIPELFGKRLSFMRNDLKWPLSRGSQFKIHSYLRWRKKPRIESKFSRHLFSKGHKLIVSSHVVQDKVTCIMTMMRHFHDIPELFGKRPFFVRNDLKWPLSGGSHFIIRSYSEWRENRRSSQDFHGIPFFKDCRTIIPVHT